MSTAYLSHPLCLLHDPGPPEVRDRITAVETRLHKSGLMDFLRRYQAPEATVEQLGRVHKSSLIKWITVQRSHTKILSKEDQNRAIYTAKAAIVAAGALVYATNLVMSGKHKTAFCNVRPPGHHATSTQAQGFCYFNNVAVGAAHALDAHFLDKVAIVDFDVHHGNGTEEIFENDPRVLFCSTFQHPYYPGCGHDTVSDHIVNVPMPYGTTGQQFRDAVMSKWIPAIHEFQPKIIFISAGFDSHKKDSMGGFRLEESDYEWVTSEICTLANLYCEGRVVSTLEGGYNLDSLAASVEAHVRMLMGKEPQYL